MFNSMLDKLKICSHENCSMWRDGLKVCFECGSSIRQSETMWTAPWIWRNK